MQVIVSRSWSFRSLWYTCGTRTKNIRDWALAYMPPPDTSPHHPWGSRLIRLDDFKVIAYKCEILQEESMNVPTISYRLSSEVVLITGAATTDVTPRIQRDLSPDDCWMRAKADLLSLDRIHAIEIWAMETPLFLESFSTLANNIMKPKTRQDRSENIPIDDLCGAWVVKIHGVPSILGWTGGQMLKWSIRTDQNFHA